MDWAPQYMHNFFMPYKPPSLYTRLKWWLEEKSMRKRRIRRRNALFLSGFRKYKAAWTVIIVCTLGAFSTFYPEFSHLINGSPHQKGISCHHPYIIDGDTFDCGGTRVRLAGIDAPEMPGHCRQGRTCTPGNPHAAKTALSELTRTTVNCEQTDTDHYGRVIARCKASGKDLSCAMIDANHAVRRYGFILCY